MTRPAFEIDPTPAQRAGAALDQLARSAGQAGRQIADHLS